MRVGVLGTKGATKLYREYLAARAMGLVTLPPEAQAQGFVSPLIGYDFGGDSGCPEIDECDDKSSNVGVSGQDLHWEREGAFTGAISEP